MFVHMFKVEIEGNLEDELRDRFARNPDLFPATQAALMKWGLLAREKWIGLVKSQYRSRNQPYWWIEGYLGPNDSNIQAVRGQGLSIEVLQDDSSLKYRFGQVIEEGRGAYDMKQMLLTSSKVRFGPRGRYLVIPMKPGGKIPDNKVDVKLEKIGERREPGGTLRNMYARTERKPGHSADFFSGRKKRSVAEFHQKQKNGIHRSQMVFVIMHERSSGWIHRPIGGFAYSKAVERGIENGSITKDGKSFNQSMAEAIGIDVLNYLQTQYNGSK